MSGAEPIRIQLAAECADFHESLRHTRALINEACSIHPRYMAESEPARISSGFDRTMEQVRQVLTELVREIGAAFARMPIRTRGCSAGKPTAMSADTGS